MNIRRAAIAAALTVTVLGVSSIPAGAATSASPAAPVTNPSIEIGPSTTPVRKNVDIAALSKLYGAPPADAILPAQGGPVPGPASYTGSTGSAKTQATFAPALNGYGLRTVCARDVWVRDAPNGWAHGVMYTGDQMDPTDYKPTWIHGYPKNGVAGGGYGWSERDAFC